MGGCKESSITLRQILLAREVERVAASQKDSGVVVLGLPAHTSYVLQSLDVYVYSSFKYFIKRGISQLARFVNCVDAFHIAGATIAALSTSFTSRNKQPGFLKTVLWDSAGYGPNKKALNELPFYDGNSKNLSTLQDVVSGFKGRQLALLFDADIDKTGTVVMLTAVGAHLTSTVVLDVLERRNQKKLAEDLQKDARELMKELLETYCESDAEKRRLIELTSKHVHLAKRLCETKSGRRRLAKKHARRVPHL